MNMELGSSKRPRNLIAMSGSKFERVTLNSNSNSNTLLVIKLPNSGLLRVASRSLLLAMVILALPSIVSILKRGGPSISPYPLELMDDSDPIGFDFFPSVLLDLSEQGLVKRADKALVISPEIDDLLHFSAFFEENEVCFTVESDFAAGHDPYPEGTFDLVLLVETTIASASNFPDRVLKDGGVLVTQLSDDPSNVFRQPPNYRIVYLRRFESTIVALRKMGVSAANFPAKRRRLCGPISAAKKTALEGLEDAVLEPPSNRDDYTKKMKFFPELSGESLDGYENRVLVTVDDKTTRGFLSWFKGNYPTRNQGFEHHGVNEKGMLGIWLRKNVKEEEFVVIKAEARVVEEMMMVEEKAICLIDELFLECGRRNGDEEEEEERTSLPYWECLALYGRIRDEGIAVHQWWWT